MVDTGRMTWADVAAVMSAAPARIGRTDTGPRAQGRPLAVGEPANLVLVDPAARWVVDPAASASLSRNSPFAGRELIGRVVATFLRGHPTVLDGDRRRPRRSPVTRTDTGEPLAASPDVGPDRRQRRKDRR